LGAQPQPDSSPDEELRQAILRRRVEQRAVTPADFERHTIEADARVARAHCLARRNVDESNQAARSSDRPGHVSVLVLPRPGVDPGDILPRVHADLDARRLLTVRVHVAPVPFVPIRLRFRLFVMPGFSPEEARGDATGALQEFLDPLTGGHDRKGWPFGRSIFVSELYKVLAKLHAVDYVSPQLAVGTTVRVDEIESPGSPSRAARNEEGELTALQLSPDELPSLSAIDLEVVTK